MRKKALLMVCFAILTLGFALQAMKTEYQAPIGPSQCDCSSITPTPINMGPQCYLKGTLVNCPEGHKMKYECKFIDDDFSWCTCAMENLNPCDPPPTN